MTSSSNIALTIMSVSSTTNTTNVTDFQADINVCLPDLPESTLPLYLKYDRRQRLGQRLRPKFRSLDLIEKDVSAKV